jgi:hypothetical protein
MRRPPLRFRRVTRSGQHDREGVELGLELARGTLSVNARAGRISAGCLRFRCGETRSGSALRNELDEAVGTRETIYRPDAVPYMRVRRSPERGDRVSS